MKIRLTHFIAQSALPAIVLLSVTAMPTISVAATPPADSPAVESSTTDISLDAPIEDISAFAGGEVVALCRAQNRPCGIEEDPSSLAHAPDSVTKIRMRKTTLRKALDQSAKLHPGKRWVVRNGVVNFEPQHRRGADLLSRKLDSVSILGMRTDAAFYLMLKQAGITTSGSFYSGTGPVYAVIDVDMKSVTVRDALNAIAKADGKVVWHFVADKPEESRASFSISTWRGAGIQ